ncbi:MAG: potassium channel family protein [Planctomycetota bacterium]
MSPTDQPSLGSARRDKTRPRQTLDLRELPKVYRRLLAGLVALGLVFVCSVCGYRWLGYPWMEAIWMVVITIATVGYGERSETNPEVMIFTIFVLLFGITSATSPFGAFVQFAVRGELESFWGRRRMKKEIEHLQGHVVLCGYGGSGELLADNLRKHEFQLVVVESDPERHAAAVDHGFPAVLGDATNEEVLLEAGLDRAATLVTNLPHDAENVFITLTGRNLSSSINIIARAESPSTARKLRQAGANRVVLPTVSGARMMARMITRPSTAELIELVSESPLPDMELDELHLRPTSPLVGIDVRSAEANRKHRLLVVSVKRTNGELHFNPEGDYQFSAGDTVILLGKREDIVRFKQSMA